MPYNPEQNGVVERKNRSIVEVSRDMHHDQKLSKFLWGEATNKAVYVQNRVPHHALDNKTPEEVFMGVKPDIGHLCIFGRKGTFVGYCEDSKAFKIYIFSQRKVEISKDVTFDEDGALRRDHFGFVKHYKMSRDTFPPERLLEKEINRADIMDML